MDFDVIVPARYASTRLPGKPLIDIGGKPLIQWVCECAETSSARSVVVATDDERIRSAVEGFGGKAFLTRSGHNSGSDRIAEIVDMLEAPNEAVVVNVQGDEPRMPGVLIDQVARILADDELAVVGTACHRIGSSEEYLDQNVVKVVRDKKGRALYFSRAPIPWVRDDVLDQLTAFRHVGIYAFRVGFLKEFTNWPTTELERTERLEQLRMLENGVAITVCDAAELPGPGIDTPEDLENFRSWVKQNG